LIQKTLNQAVHLALRVIVADVVVIVAETVVVAAAIAVVVAETVVASVAETAVVIVAHAQTGMQSHKRMLLRQQLMSKKAMACQRPASVRVADTFITLM
jgi:hypothetical protein